MRGQGRTKRGAKAKARAPSAADPAARREPGMPGAEDLLPAAFQKERQGSEGMGLPGGATVEEGALQPKLARLLEPSGSLPCFHFPEEALMAEAEQEEEEEEMQSQQREAAFERDVEETVAVQKEPCFPQRLPSTPEAMPAVKAPVSQPILEAEGLPSGPPLHIPEEESFSEELEPTVPEDYEAQRPLSPDRLREELEMTRDQLAREVEWEKEKLERIKLLCLASEGDIPHSQSPPDDHGQHTVQERFAILSDYMEDLVAECSWYEDMLEKIRDICVQDAPSPNSL